MRVAVGLWVVEKFAEGRFLGSGVVADRDTTGGADFRTFRTFRFVESGGALLTLEGSSTIG